MLLSATGSVLESMLRSMLDNIPEIYPVSILVDVLGKKLDNIH